MHIAIAGNIGCGKTTLTNMLAHHYGWTPHFEAVDYNPYLEDYYKDIPRWSFALEVYFLKERFKDLLALATSDKTIILDRSIYEGVYVFTRNNYQMGNLSERDFETYMELFDQMTEIVRYPDLMIYLRASVSHLVTNIQRRGRDYEQSIPLDYLKNLNTLYEDFIYNRYRGKVLTIEVNELDYQHRPEDFAGIIDKIDSQLFGLFPDEPLPLSETN
ncbi:MAG: deoxynucleoside kinase [Bacteroidales bacterium]|nr:deoxynucleoside kinase [Bacteroidales bacterium]